MWTSSDDLPAPFLCRAGVQRRRSSCISSVWLWNCQGAGGGTEAAAAGAADSPAPNSQALIAALQNGVSVITGGPGTGKLPSSAVCLLLANRNRSALLAAPTGRAAKRMTETTGAEAKTIHRLLEYSFTPGQGMSFVATLTIP